MRLLVAVRLASGLRASVSTGVWKPSGSPAIYKLIEQLQHSSHDVRLLLLDRDTKACNRDLEIGFDGLVIPARLMTSPAALRLLPRRLRSVAAELTDTWLIWRQARLFAPDAVYLDRSLLWPAGLLARLFRWPVVWRVLGVSPNLQEASSGGRINHLIMRWLMRSPFAMVICSRDGSGGDFWLPRLLSRETPYTVLLNGVDHALNITDAPVDLPAGKTIVTFLGRLDQLKNLKLFVAGFAKAAATEPGLHALIVGDGEERPWLLQRLKAVDGHKFSFLRGIAHTQVAGILAKTDIYVSLNAMGNLSNANLEAIRAGVCMVLPEPDPINARDVDTAHILPADTALRIALNEKALAAGLIELHRDSAQRQSRAAAIAQRGTQLKIWRERIEEEIDLIQQAASRWQSPAISLVIADLQAGGAQRVLCLLATELAARQHNVSVITLSAADKDVFHLPDNVRRFSLGLEGESHGFLSGIPANIRRIFALRKALKALRTRTVISFIGSTNVLAILASIGALWTIVISERNDPARQKLGGIWDVLRRRLYPFADLVTANSDGALTTMADWVPAERLKLVRNPVPLATYLDECRERSDDNQTILVVGRLHHQKGIDVLLDAFALLHKTLPDWRLAIAGTGPLEQELRRQADRLDIADKVTWHGFISDPAPLYAKASIFALPSRYEGMPNALLEAMAAGCACVVSDASGGPLELITDGASGLICSTGDHESLAAALFKLATDSALRRRLRTAARHRAQDYDLKRVVDQWEHLLGLGADGAAPSFKRN